MDEASSQGNTVPLRQDDVQIVPPLLLTPSCGGHRADLGEKREPRETVYDNCKKVNKQWRRSLTRHHRDREVSLMPRRGVKRRYSISGNWVRSNFVSVYCDSDC